MMVIHRKLHSNINVIELDYGERIYRLQKQRSENVATSRKLDVLDSYI